MARTRGTPNPGRMAATREDREVGTARRTHTAGGTRKTEGKRTARGRSVTGPPEKPTRKGGTPKRGASVTSGATNRTGSTTRRASTRAGATAARRTKTVSRTAGGGRRKPNSGMQG